MVRLNDLIVTHQNALSSSVCDDLISFFESNPKKYETFNNNGTPNFTQLNLTKNREEKKLFIINSFKMFLSIEMSITNTSIKMYFQNLMHLKNFA